MRVRSFLSSAAFVALMTTGAFVAPSLAQKGVTLAPSTQWAISKVAGTADQAGYCAMARRYRPNTILTVAKNQNGEASFALDFQSPKFRQSEGMQVTLDPGAGQQRAFEVYPVSNQAFVIRLGQDTPFFGALERTGYLRVEFGGQSYNFDLADIDIGATKLDTCVATAVQPAAGEETPPSSPQQVDAGASYRNEINGLRKQVQGLQEENQRLLSLSGGGAQSLPETAPSDSIVIENLTGRITALEQENQDLRTKVGQATTAVHSAEDMQAIESLKQENTALQAALVAKAPAEPDQAQITALSDEITRLKEDNKRLQDIADLANESVAAGSPANDETVTRLSAENQRLQDALAQKSGDSAQVDALKQSVAGLEKENQELKTQLASAGAADDTALQESQGQLAALKEENKRLQGIVQAKEQEGALVSELEGKITALETRNAELSAEIKGAELKTAAQTDQGAELEKLQGEISRLSASIQEKDKQLVELSALSVEIESLKTSNAELQQKLAVGTQQAGDAAALNQKIASLETENTNLMQQLQAVTDKASGETDGQIAALKTENERLQKALAEQEQLAASFKGVEEEAQKLRQENTELLAKLETAGQQIDATAQLQAALDENKALQEKLRQKEQEAAEVAALRQDIERLKTENATLASSTALGIDMPPQPAPVVQVAATPENQTALDALKAENAKLTEQLSAMGSKDEEIAALKSRLEEQQTKITEAQAAAKAAEERIAAAEAAAKPEPAAQQTPEAVEPIVLAVADPPPEPIVEFVVEPQLVPTPVAQQDTPPEEPPVSVSEEGVNVEPRPFAEAAPVSGSRSELEAEIARLEAALHNQDMDSQISTQETARRYIQLKNQLAATGEGQDPDVAGDDQISALLNFDGPTQAQLPEEDIATHIEATLPPEIPAEATPLQMEEPPPAAAEPASEDLLQAPVAAEPPQQQEQQGFAEPPLPEEAPPGEFNEAQKYEQGMARALKEPGPLKIEDQPLAAKMPQPEPEISVAPPPSGPPEEPISMRASQDPFADMKVEDDFKGYSSVQGGTVREQVSAPPEGEQPQQAAVAPPPVMEAPLASHIASAAAPVEQVSAADDTIPIETRNYNARMNGSRMVTEASVNEAYAASRDLLNSPPPVASAAAAAPAPVVPYGLYKPSFGVPQILASAKIVPPQGVSIVPGASNGNRLSYQWTAENVFGSAVQEPLSDVSGFDSEVKKYLEKTETRCTEQFAIVPDQTLQVGETRIDTYEIACIGNGISSSASLIFLSKEGTFTVLAHEAPAEELDTAMDMTDRLLKTISGS